MSAVLARHAPQALAVLRLVTAILFIEHGSQKLFGFPAASFDMAAEMGRLFYAAGLLEVVGGLLILAGFLTRPVAFVLSGEMAVAYFIAHAPLSPFPVNNYGDGAILFSFVFLYLTFAGPGAWSVDGARAEA